MASNATHDTIRTPMHLWIVGILALIWNAFGAADYVMTRFHNVAYFRSMMPDVNPRVAWAYVDTMPLLASIGWGLGVWGAVVGTLLLLARSRHAVTAYLASLVGAIVSFGFQFAGPKPPAGMDNAVIPIIVTVIAIALLLYAQRMWARGVLR